MTLTAMRRFVAATVLGGILCGAAAGDARAAGVGAPPVASRSVGVQTERAPVSTSEAKDPFDNYAQREQQSPQAGDFRGGDGAGLYIGGSTAGVVLLIVLLIILL